MARRVTKNSKPSILCREAVAIFDMNIVEPIKSIDRIVTTWTCIVDDKKGTPFWKRFVVKSFSHKMNWMMPVDKANRGKS